MEVPGRSSRQELYSLSGGANSYLETSNYLGLRQIAIQFTAMLFWPEIMSEAAVCFFSAEEFCT
jgi:hypothetical protein